MIIIIYNFRKSKKINVISANNFFSRSAWIFFIICVREQYFL